MTARLAELSVAEVRAVLARREASAVEITEACLAALGARNPRVHAFVTVTADDALAAARAADAALARGDAGPLAGVPIGVKDLLAVRGVARTNGSAAFVGDPPAVADAGAVARLRAAGAVIVGTTHLHELAFGPTGVNPALGTPANPWAAGRLPGGSSSGSGAAVAARLVPAALGTDTGGSIRIPASLCGVTGLKPTWGRVTRAGVTPLAWTLDHVGPLTRSVEDAALLLGVLAGHDPADPHLAAQRRATRLYDEMRAALARVDLLVTPATVLAAPLLDELQVRVGDTQMGTLEAICRLSGPFNLTGLPALAVPCGFTGDGRPIGLQLVGRPFAEAEVLAAGHAYQRATDWHLRRPAG